MSAPVAVGRGWVYGPLPDLLLGCGVGYALLVVGAALVPADPATILFWAVPLGLLVSTPHYGATLLRVYEKREERRRYRFFALWATLAVWLVFVAGVYERTIGSLLLTLYLTWSPWHYTGQNYGLAIMFLRRRHVDFTPTDKRWVYGSFIVTYLLFLLVLHGGHASTGYGPGFAPIGHGQGYGFLTLGIPRSLVALLYPAGLVVYAAATAIAWSRLRRVASGAASAPALLLMATQALWFVVPGTTAWATGITVRDHVIFFNVWLAVGHAVQYLWITTYYAVGRRPARERLAYLGKTLLAGAGIATLPALVFSPALLGTFSHDRGLFLLISAAINVHHFILDGAIWKLRDGPVARILLARPDPALDAAPTRAGRGPRLVLAACVPLLAITVATTLAQDVLWPAAVRRGDEALAARIERGLTWVGRDEPVFHERRAATLVARGDLAGAATAYERSLAVTPTPSAWSGLAQLRVQQGDAYGARQSYQRSLAVQPTPDAWVGLGILHEFEGDAAAAIEAYEAALALDPRYLPALGRAGRYWLSHQRPKRARRLLERAAQLAPDDPGIRADLARIPADASPRPSPGSRAF